MYFISPLTLFLETCSKWDNRGLDAAEDNLYLNQKENSADGSLINIFIQKPCVLVYTQVIDCVGAFVMTKMYNSGLFVLASSETFASVILIFKHKTLRFGKIKILFYFYIRNDSTLGL